MCSIEGTDPREIAVVPPERTDDFFFAPEAQPDRQTIRQTKAGKRAGWIINRGGV